MTIADHALFYYAMTLVTWLLIFACIDDRRPVDYLTMFVIGIIWPGFYVLVLFNLYLEMLRKMK